MSIEDQAKALEARVKAEADKSPKWQSRTDALREAAERLCGPEWEWDVAEALGGEARFFIRSHRHRG